ncbi:MAG: two-component system sensor histidine kinase NtrB [Planctomycetota bacterium]
MSTRLPAPVDGTGQRSCRFQRLNGCLMTGEGGLRRCLGAQGLLVLQIDGAGTIRAAHGPEEQAPPHGWDACEGRSLRELLSLKAASRFEILQGFGRDTAYGADLTLAPDCQRHVQGSLIPLGDGSGLLLVGRVTSQRSQARLVDEDPERLARIIDVLPPLIACVDDDLRITFINASGRTMAGVSADDHLALDDLLPELGIDSIQARGFYGESRLLHRNGDECPVDVSILPDESGNGDATVIAWDIRDRLRDDAERSDQFMQMARTQRMASLGVLVASVAHEINNPNNFVMFNAPVLRQIWQDVVAAVEDQPQWREDTVIGRRNWSWAKETVSGLLDGIDNGSERIKTMVSQLREYTRVPHARQARECDVNEAVGNAVDLVTHLIRKHTRHMIVAIPEDLPRVRMCCQELEQVILNLVVNACQALEDQGQAVAVTAQLFGDGSQVQIGVQDEGRGMPPSVLQTLGRGYVTTKRSGTGLGMAIVKRLIDQNGGSMHVESRLGLGTVVKLQLPITEGRR